MQEGNTNYLVLVDVWALILLLKMRKYLVKYQTKYKNYFETLRINRWDLSSSMRPKILSARIAIVDTRIT